MPHADLGDRSLFYERRGSGAPLLLVQGMAGHHALWGEPLLSRLDREFDVVAYDHRGIGESTDLAGGFTIADLAEDAAALMDAVGWDTAHILGISMGGMVAQELVLAHPDSADVAIRTAYEVNLSPSFRADEAQFEPFKHTSLSVRVLVPLVMRQVQAAFVHDTSTRLPTVTAPTLVLHGTADEMLRYSNGEQIASLISGSRLHRFADVGHLFWWERPDETASLLRSHCLTA